tara:strand:+ start:815 stop:973 length:159 start_codon:yes stop_codon:yes gene_type:complete
MMLIINLHGCEVSIFYETKKLKPLSLCLEGSIQTASESYDFSQAHRDQSGRI